MKNVLMIGATGMLGGLIVRLLHDDVRVYAIGRNPDRFLRLRSQAGPDLERYLTFMALDYTDLPRLGRWIGHVQLMDGPLDLVVAWIHGPAEPVLDVVGQEVEAYRQSPWDLCHVQGISASLQPPLTLSRWAFCRYYAVTLGYVQEPGQAARWLNHVEIVQGVYGALASRTDQVLGILHPFEGRPGG